MAGICDCLSDDFHSPDTALVEISTEKQFHTKLISSMLCTWLPLQESPKHCKLCPLLLHLTHDLPLKEARPPNGTQCIEAAVFIMDQLLLRIRKILVSCL